LYWADLPFAGESPEVETAMIAFRTQLLIAEGAASDTKAGTPWADLDDCLIGLSKALRESTPKEYENVD
jgi:hypothetical protein